MTGLVLLAAGASTRLGEPKQQKLYQGYTLLQCAINAAVGSVCTPVIVVLGANAEAIQKDVKGKPVRVVQNESWQEGMASSIRCGLEKLLETEPAVTSCVLMVCDQPYVTNNILNMLVQQKQENKAGIVASAYQDTWGTPVLFEKHYFPELLTLQGQEGAKKVVMKHQADVLAVPFPLGAIDIDTAADYEALLQVNSAN